MPQATVGKMLKKRSLCLKKYLGKAEHAVIMMSCMYTLNVIDDKNFNGDRDTYR